MNLKKNPINNPSKISIKFVITYFLNCLTLLVFQLYCLDLSKFRHLNKMCPQLEHLVWLVSTGSFAPWKWLGSPKIWAAVMDCLSLWTGCFESLQDPSLMMKRFKQMHGLQCPGFKATPEQLWGLTSLLLYSLTN